MRSAADSIARCVCGIDLAPEYVFLIDLGIEENFSERRSASLPDSVVSSRLQSIRSSASASLRKGVLSRRPGAIPYRWVAGGAGDEGWIAFYAVRFRSEADPGVIVGFESSAKAYADNVLAPSFSGPDLLPPSLIRSTPVDSLLMVRVASNRGSVYESRSGFTSSYTATEILGAPDTALTAIVSINPRSGSSLIIGGLPQSPLRTVLPLVSLALTLLLIAFYLSRRQETVALQLRASLSEARLAALRGQLQPHFLFNVLNSIAMLARKGESKAVVSTITQLGELLRTVLRDSPEERVTLEEELGFIEKYLGLESVRFQDRLDTSIDLPDNLKSALVPAFILQPLVENAIRHGVGKLDLGGTIAINAHTDNSSLILDVVDSGPGPALNGTTAGIGLANSRERLAQLYGNRASVDLTRQNGHGTRARIVLPLE